MNGGVVGPGNSVTVDETKFAASDLNAIVSVKVINQTNELLHTAEFHSVDGAKLNSFVEGGPSKASTAKLGRKLVTLAADKQLLQGGREVKLGLPTQKKLKTEPPLNGAIKADSYQTAVLNGDCSVHMLIERNGILDGRILGSILWIGQPRYYTAAHRSGSVDASCLKPSTGKKPQS
ncbi:hypothetical protein FALBO_12062 [Fusarium albosuccineum]|uniref:Uncharacterized protein n=1 Tax=Fusarium albosuccineum TaxID=1237068 RepID=A0A8H4P3H5_9HYPO|nr:hypothetical protein FALBO_12062 [Fusarium albosuccineum]